MQHVVKHTVPGCVHIPRVISALWVAHAGIACWEVGVGVLAMTASESSRRDVGSPQLRTMTSVHGIPGAFVPLGGTDIPSRYYPQPGACTSRAAGVGRVQLPARSAVAELDT